MKLENTLSFIIILLFTSNIYAYDKKNPCEVLINDGKNLAAIDAAKKMEGQYDKSFCLGKAYYNKNMYKLAMKSFDDSEEYSDLPADQMFSILYKGAVQRDMGNLSISSKTFTRGLETAKLGNSKYLQMERRFLYQLGENGLISNNFDESIDFFSKSIVISVNDDERASGFNALSKAYYGKKKINRSIEYGVKASNMYLKIGALSEYADSQFLLASYHLEDNAPDRSLKLLVKLEKFAIDNGSQYYEARSLLKQSIVYKSTGDIKKADIKHEKGMGIAKVIGAKDLLPTGQ
tara:strand:+ start:180 stop:1052 length:873 start_codon:yes stop_codon:yes gene_type:complete